MKRAGLVVASLFAGAAVWSADYPIRELTAEQKAAIEQALPDKAPAKPKKPRKVLVTHIAKRNGNPVSGHASIPFGNHALVDMGKKTGAYEAVINNDESVFLPKNLAAYDAIVFNNTLGVLFEDPALRRSLLDFVKNGKGFAAIHCGGGATFVQHPVYDQFPEFGEMVGGYEDGGHPWLPNEVTHVKIDDPKSPLTAMFKGPFEIYEETYQFREPTLRDRLHVLLSIDVSKMPAGRKILKQRQQDMDFPVSWVKPYGKGRVFYTMTGHSPDAFKNPLLLQHYLAGIQFAAGDIDADVTPSDKLKGAAR
jgi:uncharacterized protein